MRTILERYIAASKYSIYYGLDDSLTSLVQLQDEIDDRFKKNEYIDLITCTLLYHQMAEKFIESLILQHDSSIFITKGYSNDSLTEYFYKNNPKRVKKYMTINTFSFKRKCLDNLVHNNGYKFKDATDFLNKSKYLNDVRNNIAHAAIRNDQKEVIHKLNRIKGYYHRIKEIYITATFDAYHNIIAWMNEQIRDESTISCFSKDDLDQLAVYIRENFNSFDHLESKGWNTIELYEKVYNNIHSSHEIIDLDYILRGYVYECLSEEETLKLLRL